MPTVTIYATGAGSWRDLAGDGVYSSTTNSTPEADVPSGGVAESKDAIGWWTWTNAPGLQSISGAIVSSATVALQCTTTDATAPHSHVIEVLTEDPLGTTSPPTTPGGSVGTVTTNNLTMLNCASVVQDWVNNPSTAYGFTADLSQRENDSTAHSFEGYDTARLTVTYTIWSVNGTDTLASPQSNGLSTFTPSENLIAGVTYSWRARVSDGQATSGWTTPRTFTVQPPTRKIATGGVYTENAYVGNVPVDAIYVGNDKVFD